MTQSAVCQHVRALEAELGERLSDIAISDVHAHFVVWRANNPKPAAIEALRRWLRAEVGQGLRR
ncbi:helix-turn-helix domain-containing protein [Aliidongia dinghuensis]|uniref:helix-turn-helix domain-containing protein n=1 Tax=Aliidongia dinghuensis TaxID=1867774 RepID=UPI0027E49534|nr:LysR family transcriptional regulator [Aliidongia dinghuensis]